VGHAARDEQEVSRLVDAGVSQVVAVARLDASREQVDGRFVAIMEMRVSARTGGMITRFIPIPVAPAVAPETASR
jgi:hypothetical protein